MSRPGSARRGREQTRRSSSAAASERLYPEERLRQELPVNADPAAMALENARLLRSERDGRAQLEALGATTADLTRELDLAKLLTILIQRAVTLLQGVSGVVYLFDPAADCIAPKAWVGHGDWLAEARLRVGEGLVGTVIQRREGMIENAYRTSPYAHPLFLARTTYTAVLGEPLVYRDRIIGAVLVDRQDSGFTEPDRDLLRLFADQAAIAIENAHLYGEAEQRRREAEILGALTQTITASLDRDTVLRRVAEGAKALCESDLAAIALLDGTTLAFRTWVGGVSSTSVELRIRPGQGLGGRVLAEGRPLRTVDYRTDPAISADFHEVARAEGLRAALAVPIRIEGAAVGVLFVFRRTARAFADTDEAFLIRLADHAAIAIENARLCDATLRRAKQLTTVHTLSQDLAATLDPQEALRAILAAATVLIPGTVGQVWEPVQDAETLRLTADTSAAGGREPLLRTFRRDEGLAGLAMTRGCPVVSLDVQTDPRFVNRAWAAAEGFVAAIAIPLAHRDALRGVLVLLTREPHHFDQEEQTLVQLFANDAAIAIEKARLFTAERRRRQQLDAVRAITAEITRELDPSAVLQLIATRVGELFRSGGAVWLWDEAARALVTGAVTGERDWRHAQTVRLGEGLVGQVAERREGLLVNDYRAWPHARAVVLQRTRVTAAMAEPLLYRDRLIGVLSIDSEIPETAFTADDRQLLRLFADQAAIAIANAQLFRDQQDAYKDLERAQDGLVRAEKLRALGQLAAGVAHDLNNTLAAVLGQAELLRLRSLEPGAQEALRTLELAATDGALIVRRLQDFARQRASGGPAAPCDLGEVVRQALEFTRPQWKDAAERQGRRIDVQAEMPSLPPILGDPAALREALANLILNAVDAMPQGGTLRLRGRVAPPAARDHGALVELTVADSGVGIPEEVRERIFEPFFTTKGFRGTGLGLSVVYGILERHSGRIDVASAPGRGTTFTLHLPVAPPDASPPAAPVAPVTFLPRRILVVDDEPLVRETLATLLRAVGHTVYEAADGPAGLAHLAADPVDLVLTDLGMPGMTGTEVARAVKARHPHLPVVLLTGWGEYGMSDSSSGGVVDRVLSKPVRLGDLVQVIHDLSPAGGAPDTNRGAM